MTSQNSTCQHLNLFYSTVDQEPLLYWIFDSEILGDATLQSDLPGPEGNKCHINAKNLTDDQAGEIFKNNFNFTDCNICSDGINHQFSSELFKELFGQEIYSKYIT